MRVRAAPAARIIDRPTGIFVIIIIINYGFYRLYLIARCITGIVGRDDDNNYCLAITLYYDNDNLRRLR